MSFIFSSSSLEPPETKNEETRSFSGTGSGDFFQHSITPAAAPKQLHTAWSILTSPTSSRPNIPSRHLSTTPQPQQQNPFHLDWSQLRIPSGHPPHHTSASQAPFTLHSALPFQTPAQPLLFQPPPQRTSLFPSAPPAPHFPPPPPAGNPSEDCIAKLLQTKSPILSPLAHQALTNARILQVTLSSNSYYLECLMSELTTLAKQQANAVSSLLTLNQEIRTYQDQAIWDQQNIWKNKAHELTASLLDKANTFLIQANEALANQKEEEGKWQKIQASAEKLQGQEQELCHGLIGILSQTLQKKHHSIRALIAYAEKVIKKLTPPSQPSSSSSSSSSSR